jgi:hypothetical protein
MMNASLLYYSRGKSMKSIKPLFVGAVLAGLVSVGATVPAQATLLGDEIGASLSGSSPISLIRDTLTVGPGLEFVRDDRFRYTADFDGDSVTLAYAYFGSDPVGVFVGRLWTFTDLDWTDQPGFLTGVTPLATNQPGASVISVGPDSFSIELPGDVRVDKGDEQSWTFNLEAEHFQVPESGSTLAMLGLVTAALMGMHRRRA